MNTNKFVVVSLSFIAGISLSACGKNLAQKAEIASRELQIPITVKTSNDDACASRQFNQIYADWKRLNKARKAEVVQELKKLSEIVVKPSIVTGKRVGEVSHLILIAASCNQYSFGNQYYGSYGFWDPRYNIGPISRWQPLDWYPSASYGCINQFVESKVIADSTRVEGTAPVSSSARTTGDDGRVTLSFQSNSNIDESTQRNFATYWWSMYNQVTKLEDLEFQNARGRGFVRRISTFVDDSNEALLCGEPVRLASLFEGTPVGTTLFKLQGPALKVEQRANLENE